MSVFDRVNVFIGNIESSARPVEFVTDRHGEVTGVLKYEATCPGCGCMLHFTSPGTCISCKECGAGNSKKVTIPKDSLSVAVSGQRVEYVDKPKIVEKVIDRGCPFVDPIELGIFSVT